ncbi:hypothetical protein JQC91_08300 [Jannaschia sp. Os4]|uniref:hypothetical protein n=1 Tax=Jannaschia sp. Os4 TaxID=2807617 RepID=UPI001939D97A|nr:hypothetical protein [Jannaschia sp. Os4]MBM2576305.1 hypothetical protein [Jannaschia sp. Os4]
MSAADRQIAARAARFDQGPLDRFLEALRPKAPPRPETDRTAALRTQLRRARAIAESALLRERASPERRLARTLIAQHEAGTCDVDALVEQYRRDRAALDGTPE